MGPKCWLAAVRLVYSHITEALQANGYPNTLLMKNRTSRPLVTDIPTEKPSAKVTLPYVQGQSEAIRGILQNLNIKTSFKPVTIYY